MWTSIQLGIPLRTSFSLSLFTSKRFFSQRKEPHYPKNRIRSVLTPGLYAKRGEKSYDVSYLYYAPFAASEMKCDAQYQIQIFAHSRTHTSPTIHVLGEYTPMGPLVTSHPSKQTYAIPLDSEYAIHADLNHLVDLPSQQPVACELYLHAPMSRSSRQVDLRDVDFLEHCYNWGIRHYLQSHYSQHADVHLRYDNTMRWLNYTWLAVLHDHHSYSEGISHALALRSHVMDLDQHDPITQPIPVVTDEYELTGYRNLFYTQKNIGGLWYTGLDCLSSAYVYWILAEDNPPTISEPIQSYRSDEDDYLWGYEEHYAAHGHNSSCQSVCRPHVHTHHQPRLSQLNIFSSLIQSSGLEKALRVCMD